MREPVVDSGDGQLTDDDLVSGLIDDCAGELEKNNLWDANTTSSIKHFSDIYNITSQEGDDDDDDSLSFDRLLGHARLEKCSMESWMAGISSSDTETPTGIKILATTSVLRPLIPAALVPAGILRPANGSLPPDQGLVPMARPIEQVTLIPVNEHSAKLAFAPATHVDLPTNHIPNVLVSQSLPVTASSSQSSALQVWTSASIGEGTRTTFSTKSQIKPSRSRANRPKVEMAKPAMNEKESHELERVMDILKRYKQQLAESDQIGQFLPCKRKRSKPPSQCTDSSGSYPKSSETAETLEHEKTGMPDLTNSKYTDKPSVNHLPATINYRYDGKATESKPQADVNDGTSLMQGDGSGMSEVKGLSNVNMANPNPIIYANILTGTDSVSSFSPGNSYGGTPPVSVLQCSPSTTDQASRCTSVGVEYQLDSAQGLARYQNQPSSVTGFACGLSAETVAEACLMKLPFKSETDSASVNSLLCAQKNSVATTDQSELEVNVEPLSTLCGSSKKNDFISNLCVEEETNLSSAKLTVEQIRQNTAEPVPACTCLTSSGEVFDETKEGPYYTQLGAAESVAKIRDMMERRLGITRAALRIEKIIYTGKEGKNLMGCPAAKWIIRRSSQEEKVLCLVRRRPGHTCATAVLVIGIVIWEGISDSHQSDSLYEYLTQTLSLHGLSTERRCGSNDQKTCSCQGWDSAVGGASFTFGCSWSMFYNGCKFAKSSVPRKFRLKKQQEEERLEQCLNQLASDISPLYARAAPDSFRNQTQAGSEANDCRLGNMKPKPWSGVTAVVDYCTHSHKDINNMHNGCVAVVTLTKHRSSQGKKPEDEQLHVLPLYVMDSTDEFDSVDGQRAKVLAGAVECLTKFPSVMRIQQQRTNSQPRRHYRNKSKPRGIPSEKIPKKVAKVPRKRLRPSSSKTTRVTPQSLLEAAQKGREMRAGKESESGEEDCTKSDAQSVKDTQGDATPSGMRTVGDPIGDKEEALGTAIESVFGDVGKEGNGKVRSGNGSASNSISCGPFPDGSSGASRQQILDAQFSQNVAAPRPRSDMMETMNTWHGRTDADVQLQKPQQIQKDGLQVFWNLDGGDNDGMDIGSNQWMKRIESSCDLRNRDKASQNNDLITVNSVGGPSRFQTGLCLDSISTNQQKTVVTSGHQSLVSGKKPLLLTQSKHVTLGRHDVALAQLAQRMTGQQTVSENEGSIPQPASSSSAIMSTGFPQKCGGFLQLLNGDEDIDYADGCVNSHDYCPQYLHVSSSMGKNQKEEPLDEAILRDAANRTVSKSKPKPEGNLELCHEINTNNDHLFKDSNIGGVAIALTHGSVFFEVAKREMHATTALKIPNRFAPTRIALIFYQHKHLNHPNHGSRQTDSVTKQEKPSFAEKDTKSFDECRDSPGKSHHVSEPAACESSSSQGDSNREMIANLPAAGACLWTAPVNNVHTLTTTTMVTKWIQPKLATSGPYQCWG